MFKNYAFSWRIIRSGQEILLALRKEIEMVTYKIVETELTITSVFASLRAATLFAAKLTRNNIAFTFVTVTK